MSEQPHAGEQPTQPEGRALSAAEQRRPRRGMGHKRGTWPSNARSTKHLLGARVGLPTSAMALQEFIDHIRDQGATETCVGQATARALHLRLCAMLKEHPQYKGQQRPAFPSALAIYQLAVQAEGNEQFGDNGSDPAKAMAACADKGIPREDIYPFPKLDEWGNPVPRDAVTHNVPLDVLEQAIDFKLGPYYLVDSDEDHAPDDVRQALAVDYPITIAVDVDDAFNSYKDGVLEPPQGHLYGGHDIVLFGYEGDIFWGVNSWGSGWGIGGLFKMSARAVAKAYDKFAVEAVPLWPEQQPAGAERVSIDVEVTT